jgi:hypothetical protein
MSKTDEYENEKRKILKKDLTASEYEKAIKELCEKLKY